MKSPTKPPAPPPSNRGFDDHSSGRARKDVNYVPVPSGSLRAKPPLPSASTNPDDPQSAYDDDLIEDMATPTRTPKVGNRLPPFEAAPTPAQEWQPLPTGPMQVIAPPVVTPVAPPPSQRSFTPQPQSLGPFAPPSSARVRQPTPLDTPSYVSQHGPASSPSSGGQQITGPQLPVPLISNTGSYPSASGHGQPPSSRSLAPEEGVPLGYVVASAFFLAIALVGFGLYLAFEVISL